MLIGGYKGVSFDKYTGMMEKKMETSILGLHRDYIGVI